MYILKNKPRALFIKVVFPFTLGYFISYLFRTINAVIAPYLIIDMHINASTLGFLTGIYFLSFAIFQLPLGILLDKLGPKKTEAILLIIAGIGAIFFAKGNTISQLVLGRACIGIGVSACLMAGMKATSTWFPARTVPAMNAWIMAGGGMGAIFSTAPIKALLNIIDWRTIFIYLAILTMLSALLIILIVPSKSTEKDNRKNFKNLTNGFITIFKTSYFWKIAPIVIVTQASFMAIQSLWVGTWLRDVAHKSRDESALILLYTAFGMVAGFFLVGNISSYLLRRFNISVISTMGIFIVLFFLTQICIILEFICCPKLLWMAFTFFGSSTVLGYPILSNYFGNELTGRAITSCNMLVFSATFLFQWITGIIINLFKSANGYSPLGYKTAFIILLIIQLLLFLPYTTILKKQHVKTN